MSRFDETPRADLGIAVAAGLLGAAGVTLAAVAAHRVPTPAMASAAQMLMVHAVAVLAISGVGGAVGECGRLVADCGARDAARRGAVFRRHRSARFRGGSAVPEGRAGRRQPHDLLVGARVDRGCDRVAPELDEAAYFFGVAGFSFFGLRFSLVERFSLAMSVLRG